MRRTGNRFFGLCVALAFIAAGLIFNISCGSLFAQFFAEVAVSEHDLTFEATEGGENPESQEITAYCSMSDFDPILFFYVDYPCEANITTNQTWLTVSPTSIYGEGVVTVSVDIEGLEAGEHLGNVHVEYILVSVDDEEDVNVTLTINPAPEPEPEEDEVFDEEFDEDGEVLKDEDIEY